MRTVFDVGALKQHRVALIVILRVLHEAKSDLFQITLTTRPSRILTRAGEDWKQDCRKKSDHSNDDKKFNQRKTIWYCSPIPAVLRERSPHVVSSSPCLNAGRLCSQYLARSVENTQLRTRVRCIHLESDV